MPKLYGARYEGIQRKSRCSVTLIVNLDVCRIELGPSRRDPQGALSSQEEIKSVLQSASAMGSFAVSRKRAASGALHERQPSGVMPRSTTFDFGVSVVTRSAHVNRAGTRLSPEDRAPAPNHRRGHDTRRCSLQNLDCKVHEVHG